jgi:glucokinase
MKLATIDIGGTHARFALADAGTSASITLGEAVTLRTSDHVSLQSAWEHFGASCDEPLPKAVSIAIAAPVGADEIKLTNNEWVIQRSALCKSLSVDRHLIINDFAAVGHAVAQAGAEEFAHLCGPDVPLPVEGTISIVGPGTGLGVAHIWRGGGDYRVQSTEGGHLDFAPLDAFEDALLVRMRTRFGRVSMERIVSGPGLVELYETLAAREGKAVQSLNDKALWQLALAGEDSLAVAAAERFCMSLGSVAGDIALAQGAAAVVIAGGLGLRIKGLLKGSGFAQRFCAKGRFEKLMSSLPVKLITHPQPGLFGAAAAFAKEFC